MPHRQTNMMIYTMHRGMQSCCQTQPPPKASPLHKRYVNVCVSNSNARGRMHTSCSLRSNSVDLALSQTPHNAFFVVQMACLSPETPLQCERRILVCASMFLLLLYMHDLSCRPSFANRYFVVVGSYSRSKLVRKQNPIKGIIH